MGAQFGEGNVSFSGAQFGEGNVSFSGAQFGEGCVHFNHMRFGSGNFVFLPRPISATTLLDFQYAAINGALVLSGLHSLTVPNLSNTKLGHPVELHDVKIQFRKQLHWLVFTKAVDPEDSSSFRRLKKLAKEANDHERALEFFAQEKRSDYWRGTRGVSLFFYYLYDWLSNYGRSVIRPLGALGIITLGFAKAYQALATQSTAFGDALVFSVSHALPFYQGARDAKTSSLDLLFKAPNQALELPNDLHALTLSQGILSGVLIFLVALALRNLFRS